MFNQKILKMKNFENCNVRELNQKEIREIEGGGIFCFLITIVVAGIIVYKLAEKYIPPPKLGSGGGGGGTMLEAQMNKL